MIVLDASAAVDLIARIEPLRSWVADRIEGEAEVHSPELLDVEVLSALRRCVRRNELDQPAGTQAVTDLLDLAIVRYPHRPFVERAWALRETFNPCDALYVALAEALGATLLTTDRRFAGGVATVAVLSPE